MARVKVVKVDGEPEYHELFKRLSLASSQHPTCVSRDRAND
jgi:hypothetical protein